MTAQPWHQLCILREDVRSGALTLNEFAADLNDVRTGDARPVYREPAMFFDRTYPTYRMKVLARDVLMRLAGKNARPVLRLQVAYGGGKTHTLITLLHLAERGADMAAHKTVAEFLTFAGLTQHPRARVALLPCDKFDVKEGLEVYGPDGKTRRVHTLWGALAYQLAGDVGYARLKSHDEDFTVPAQPLLEDLLHAPIKEGLGALVLVDEAVWYYRGLVNQDQRMLGTIKDFYQVLTQAVSKVERASMVAGLIASKVEANDQTGTQCLAALEDVFRRIGEPVEPVSHEDVAEVLRRRLFDRVAGETERRPAVDAVMAGMQRLPLREAQRDQSAYDRLMDSYPFHPDLIEVLYQKWTQISGFQRTRGALRLLAYALRDSDGRDPSPIVGPGALLPYSSDGVASGLSAALNELVEVCDETQKWTSILTGELGKAREIQAGLPTLNTREVEQAAVSTFLHSQPIGQRASHSDLFVLLAHPSVDASALEEGLRKWRTLSWFLIEDPDAWQLGTSPNLTHMHVQAMNWLNEPEIDDELDKRIRGVTSLKAADSDVQVHTLPESPRAVEDDLRLHYVILGPECAVEPGRPLPTVVEAYFNEKTSPQDPRIYRNNILALVPEVSRVAGLREQVRRWLGWGRLEQPEVKKLLTDRQQKQLPKERQEAANGLPEAVVAAYNILVAVDDKGQVHAQTLRADSTISGGPFERIKAMLTDDERLVTTVLDSDLILPGSYLALWSEAQAAQRVTGLMAAFGQFPRLPRLLRPASLFETLTNGVRDGVLVLRLPRADGSAHTWWRVAPDEESLHRSELEVQPASNATLHNLEPELLVPGRLTGLWPLLTGPIKLKDLHGFFDGARAPRLAQPVVLESSVRVAVQRGLVMARVNGRTLFKELLPDGALSSELELLPAPPAIHGADLTPQALPQVWSNNQTSLQAIADALSARQGFIIPWMLLGEGVNEALRLRLFECTPESGPWPCSPVVADQVHFCLVEQVQLSWETVVAAVEYADSSVPTLHAVKEIIETQFLGRKVQTDVFIDAVRQAIERRELVESDVQLNQTTNPLTVRVKRPAAALLAEAALNPMAVQKLAERMDQLLTIAPELNFSFRVTLCAEGERVSAETLKRLNEVLAEIQQGWKLS